MDTMRHFKTIFKGLQRKLLCSYFFWKKVNFAKDYLDSFVDSVSVHLLYWLSRAPVTSYFRLCIQLLEVKMIIDLFFSCLLSWWLIELLWNTIASNCFSGVFRSLANDELSSRFWHTYCERSCGVCIEILSSFHTGMEFENFHGIFYCCH